jgi:SAM-dependent methyltransferase
MGHEVWEAGGAYEAYVGRWSRLVADEFVAWLDAPPGRSWLDVGCGTGALTAAALGTGPARVTGIDRSTGFLTEARSRTGAGFAAGDARALPVRDGRSDVVVSGLALNFVPEPQRAVAEFARVTAPGGTAAAYVWDYGDGMEMMRHFWDAAAILDPGSVAFDEGRRFTMCAPGPLAELWAGAGFGAVETRAIDVPTVFTGFADFWQPFLGGQGSAPGYVASLPDRRRTALRDLLLARLPTGPDGTVRLTARAWAVQGKRG